jgi:hypothetical protein
MTSRVRSSHLKSSHLMSCLISCHIISRQRVIILALFTADYGIFICNKRAHAFWIDTRYHVVCRVSRAPLLITSMRMTFRTRVSPGTSSRYLWTIPQRTRASRRGSSNSKRSSSAIMAYCARSRRGSRRQVLEKQREQPYQFTWMQRSGCCRFSAIRRGPSSPNRPREPTT